MSKHDIKMWRAFAYALCFMLEIVFFIILGFFIGTQVDAWFNTAPFALFIGLILGIIFSFWFVIRNIRKI